MLPLLLSKIASIFCSEPVWAQLVPFAALLIIHLVSPRGMGFGDVRLASILGLFLGWLSLGHVALGLFAGFALGALVGGVLILARRAERRQALPFGPFLAAGTVVTVLFGHHVLSWYAGL